MKFLKWLTVGLLAATLAACGGGGGSSGTSPLDPTTVNPGTSTPTLTLSLQDSSGTVLATPTLTGTQNAVAVARVLTAAGAPVANTLVTVTSTGLTLTPASGQTLTDSTGTARIQIRPTDPFGSGATTLSASAVVSGTAVQASVAIGLGAATASLSNMTVSATTVPAYQTIQVSVTAALSGAGGAATQYPVSFSSSCGSFDPVIAITDSNGVARSAYRNQAGTSTACSGPQSLIATAGTSTATATITAQSPVAANLVFVSSTPSRIYLNGSPGASQSLVRFKLVDSNNNPVQGENVTLTLSLKPTGTYLGANAGTTTLQQPTNSDGTVDVAVNAGAQPGPVQVQATLVSNPAINNVSNSLSIASGLPVQKAFSLSVSIFNIEALDTDGISTDVTLRIADRLGNPVPDGTIVNFITEGGQIVGSCSTLGAVANSVSSCTVQLVSQLPRPSNGRQSVLAWAQGEETFIDAGTPTNNVYDAGETFEDLGQPFLDKNENGTYEPGTDVTVGTASGTQPCPTDLYSVPNTCNGQWPGGALVRARAVITFSGSDPVLSDLDVQQSGRTCAFVFKLADVNGNPMPADTTLAVSGAKGGGDVSGAAGAVPDAVSEGIGGEGAKVPNTSRQGGTTHSAIFSNCVNPSVLTFKLVITTPRKQKVTTIFMP